MASPLLTLGQQDDEEDEDRVAEGLESHLTGDSRSIGGVCLE